ncbi:MAG: anthranilate phosphoribosyltransferase family protein [Cyanobacteria bacterium Co-bin8]|nr:anthranilate phosphoribosyltransferase family protein [Cyanobacteria bacterium Co-bin8]
MSQEFRELLKKVGSGSHTSKDLSREESALATQLMLLQEATPAQIGAFMISHRIKRPTAAELAGMLDAYEALGPTLPAIASAIPVMVLGCPYDGRSRTAPVTPLTALILAAAGAPVLLHGGDRMPTKEGIPLIEIWQALGLSLDRLDLAQVHTLLERTGFGFIYLPQHFPAAQSLVPYREQIGKRPPFATIELMWSPYGGASQTVTGYVHPPTEGLAQQTFQLRGLQRFIAVKGLEGSCDLPRSRTAIIGLGQPDGSIERVLLHPRDYGFAAEDVPFEGDEWLHRSLASVLQGEPSELMRSTVWNGGFYLWRSGVSESLEAGLTLATTLIQQGQVQAKLDQLRQAVLDLTLAASPVGLSIS